VPERIRTRLVAIVKIRTSQIPRIWTVDECRGGGIDLRDKRVFERRLLRTIVNELFLS
jgi:hypothetical protein